MAEWRYRCPRGHANIRIGRDRFHCGSCPGPKAWVGYDKTELVDLQKNPDALR